MRLRRLIARFSCSYRGRPVPLDRRREARVQRGPPMRKRQRRARVGREQITIRICQPPEHRIGRRHGRQREIDPMRPPVGEQAMRQGKRRLGLAAASKVLDHRQRRAVRQRHRLRPLLDPRWHDVGEQAAQSGEGGGSRCRQSRRRQGRRRPWQSLTPEIGRRIVQGSCRHIGKPRLVGPHPVGKRGQAGKAPGQPHDIAFVRRPRPTRWLKHRAHRVEECAGSLATTVANHLRGNPLGRGRPAVMPRKRAPKMQPVGGCPPSLWRHTGRQKVLQAPGQPIVQKI